MSYKVTITYEPKNIPADRVGDSICPLFTMDNAYCDCEAYDGSIYDTNVAGNGEIEQVEPFATTSIPMSAPLAQFKLAAVADEEGKVEFEVEDYQEAFYYKTLGVQLADQGFVVTVNP